MHFWDSQVKVSLAKAIVFNPSLTLDRVTSMSSSLTTSQARLSQLRTSLNANINQEATRLFIQDLQNVKTKFNNIKQVIETTLDTKIKTDTTDSDQHKNLYQTIDMQHLKLLRDVVKSYNANLRIGTLTGLRDPVKVVDSGGIIKWDLFEQDKTEQMQPQLQSLQEALNELQTQINKNASMQDFQATQEKITPIVKRLAQHTYSIDYYLEETLDIFDTNLSSPFPEPFVQLTLDNYQQYYTDAGKILAYKELWRDYTNSTRSIETIVNELDSKIFALNATLDPGVDIKTLKNNINELELEIKEKFQLLNQELVAAQALDQMQKTALSVLRSEQKALNGLSHSISQNALMLNFASSLSKDTRLAKLSNPYTQDLEFAQWIENIKGKVFAQNNIDNKQASLLDDVIMSYEHLRLITVNNLWANIGSIAGTNNGVDSVSGVLSIGYDAWIRSMILGGYTSYSYMTNSIANLDSSNSAHNADIGMYARFFINQNEIDINLGENFGFNFLSLKESLLDTTLKSDYTTFQTHLDLSYGYVFAVGNKGWFSKPFVGIGYNYGYSSKMQAKDEDVSMSFSAYQTHFASVNVGVEIRKYFNDKSSYFYISPAFYQGALFQDTQNITTSVYSGVFNATSVTLGKKHNLDTSFLLKVGGEWQVAKDLYINASIGGKIGNIARYGIINIGGRWSF